MLPSISGPPEDPAYSTSPGSSTGHFRSALGPQQQQQQQPQHQQQEYSCILCKQRKVRCDRATPCSGCVRAGVECIPGVRQPYKRRKRNGSSRDEGLPSRARSDSLSSRMLDSRPLASAEEPRPDRPQVPTFGQYVDLISLLWCPPPPFFYVGLIQLIACSTILLFTPTPVVQLL